MRAEERRMGESPKLAWNERGRDIISRMLTKLCRVKRGEWRSLEMWRDGPYVTATHINIAPDNRWAVIAGDDGIVRRFDLSTNKLTKITGVQLRGHAGPLTAQSLNWPWLITGGTDHTIRVWNLQHDDPNVSVEVLRGHDHPISALAISKQSNHIFGASGDGTTRRYTAGETESRWGRIQIRGVPTCISRNGRWAVLKTIDGETATYDLHADSGERKSFPRASLEDYTTMAITDDGCWIAVGTIHGTMCRYHLREDGSMESQVSLRCHSDRDVTTALGITPDERWIVSGCWDGFLERWDLKAADPNVGVLRLCAHQNARIERIALSQNGMVAAVIKPPRSLPGEPLCGVYGVYLWQINADDPARTKITLIDPRENAKLSNDPITALAFSLTGKWLASGHGDGAVRLWNIDTTSVQPSKIIVPHKQTLSMVTFTQCEQWLISVDVHGRIMRSSLLNSSKVQDQVTEIKEAGKEVTAMRLDGKRLFVGDRMGTVGRYDIHAPEPRDTAIAFKAHNTSITMISLTADQRWLVTGCSEKSIARWQMTVEGLLEQARNVVGRSLFVWEWGHYFGAEQPEPHSK
jgi:WD40 repeat protein